MPPTPTAGATGDHADTREDRALLVAISLLTRQVTGLTAQIVILNASRAGAPPATQPTPAPAGGSRGPAGGGGGGVIGTAIGVALGRQFGALLSPLARLSTFLESSASGFGLLNSAIKVFASALAPLLLPVFVILAAALVSVSEVIWRKVLPNLEDWMQFLIANAIPAVQDFIDALEDAADWVEENLRHVRDQPTQVAAAAADPERASKGQAALFAAIDAVAMATLKTPGITKQLGVASLGVLPPQNPAAAAAVAERREGRRRERVARRERRDQGQGGADLTDFRTALKLTVQELKQSIGPAASYSGFAERARSLQLAALNVSPFERIVQDRLLQVVDLLGKAVSNTTQPEPPRLPRKDDQ